MIKKLGAEAPLLTMGEGPWPRNDEALVSYVRTFIRQTKRPEDLKGRSRTKPTLIVGFGRVWPFDVTPEVPGSRVMIPCARCGTEHLKGHVLWFPDKWIRLIGHCCAAKYFGVKGWAAEEERLRNALAIESRTEEFEKVVRVVGPAAAEINDPVLQQAVREYDRVRDGIRQDLPEAFNYFAHAAKHHGGRLLVAEQRDERVRSFFHDAAALGRGRGADSRKASLTSIGTLPFPQMWKDVQNLRGALSRARTELNTLAGQISERAVEAFEYAEQGALIENAREGVSHALDIQARLQALAAFMEGRVLEAAVRYLNDQPRRKLNYKALRRGLEGFDGSDTIVVRLRDDFRLPSLPGIAALNVALPVKSRRRS